MKKTILFAGVILVSSVLFSCGGSSSCVSSEKYIPAYFDHNIDLNYTSASTDRNV